MNKYAENEGLIRIETQAGKSETIGLKEEPKFFPEDNSFLMRWHETDLVTGNAPEQFHYATAIMPGYVGVRNLATEEAFKLFDYKNQKEEGLRAIRRYIDTASPTLLLPLQGGMCPYDCQGCPFAVHAEGNRGKKTKNLNAGEIKRLIEESLREALRRDIDINTIGVAFVGSGDATPNQNLREILEMMIKDFSEKITRVRVSTVAGMVQGEHQTPMQVVSDIYSNQEYTGTPIINIQVSAHNTNESERALHVFNQRPLKERESLEQRAERLQKGLLPLSKVAEQFLTIMDIQKQRNLLSVRKPSLTFVCTNKTHINVAELQNLGFVPENTVIQLRPILTKNPVDRMSGDDFKNIYNGLREAGYDVVIMPVSPSAVELEAG